MARGNIKIKHSKGQLKVSSYVNYGLLTVHIIQARHLGSKLKPVCDAYVKVSMAPDVSQRTSCATDVIRDTNHPMFDEKFSFELLEGDLKKRIFISVWNKDKSGGRSEFLGCMSFGIHSIQSGKKVVNGWYYLLAEEVGRYKHLQAVTKRTSQEGRSSDRLVSSVNQDIRWMDSHVFELQRGGSHGFGFSVTGGCPVQVSRIDRASSASSCGLKTQDFIVRINGQNVSRSSCENVAKIIRHCPQKVILEVQRPCTSLVKPMENSPWRPKGIRPPLDASTPCWPETRAFTKQDHFAMTHECSMGDLDKTPPPLRIEDLDDQGTPYGGRGEFANETVYY